MGVMDTGITYRQMNGLMATMEVKGLHHTSMMRRRLELDPYVQDVANESCADALAEEAGHSPASTCSDHTDSEDTLSEENCCCCCKYDMCWQRRGSGKGFNSKSGVGTLMGNHTGKIIGCDIRTTDCRMCSLHDHKEVPEHDCNKNWSGSAKAMEADVGVELIKSVEKQGAYVKTLIMDDDASTMAKIKRELGHAVIKWSDINHTTKHLVNSLYTLQKKHKCLTGEVIGHLKKCFNYALAQTKGDAEKCKLQIEQITPHVFGDHVNCGTWCGFVRDEDNYQPGTLKKPLTGDIVRMDMTAVFCVFSGNADKIAPGGSTKDVESFNSMVAAKAPKRCHFSSTGNLRTRVSCAVAQKNLGYGYISSGYEKLGLSPGKVYRVESKKRDTERKRQKEYSSKKENKLKKLKKKLSYNQTQRKNEKKEGITYQTAVATTENDGNDDDVPPATRPPSKETVEASDDIQIVICDLETGDLTSDCDILQIAACTEEKTFDQYVLPKKGISPQSSKVTGLRAQGGVLFLNGSPVVALPLREAMKLFVEWLSAFGRTVLLVGHNFKGFDFPKILRAASVVGLQAEFQRVCVGGSDTLYIFKEKYPKPQMEKHTQQHLFETLLKEKYDAHNALADVISLKKLMDVTSVTPDAVYKHSFTTEMVLYERRYKEESDRNLPSLLPMAQEKGISAGMLRKIASSGLRFHHLMSVFNKQGPDGLRKLLSEKTVHGCIRVTKTESVLSNIVQYFTKLTTAAEC